MRGCKLSAVSCARQPLVTTGGGALPLPVCAQPATLNSAITAAIAIATFFIPHLLFRYSLYLNRAIHGPLVLKSHTRP